MSIIEKVSLQATTVCRQPHSDRKSKRYVDVHGKRTEYVFRVFLIPRNEL
jgi:hypothetical protein